MKKKYLQLIPGVLILCSLTLPTSGQAQNDTTGNAEDSLINRIPVISNLDEIDNGSQSQDIAGMLQSSRDIFTNTAGYTFGAARFRVRGYQSDMTNLMINGIPMNDLESGWGTWYRWGGLNDVTRYAEVQTGIAPNDYNFGGLGGYTNINMRATNMRKGTRISYAYTNRAYRHRVMASHSTGMMENGWAISLSASGRYAEEGYVEGSYYRAMSYYLAVQKKINDKHSINLSIFGAPNVVGRQSLAQQEAYDLTGSNYYNSYWGYQTDPETGEQVKRNSRVRNTHLPTAILTYDFDFKNDHNSKLTVSAFTSYGRSGQTRLNWYDAKDPRPDYYRYLPSYYEETNPAIANQLTDAWQNDPLQSQLDWDALYNANYKNLYTVENVNGEAGVDTTGLRSKYIVEENRRDELYVGGNAIFNHNFTDRLSLVGGLNILYQSKHYFQVVDDLLGGDFWLNINQFAERDNPDPDAAQYDIENPNQLIYEGEKFGYDYNIVTQSSSLFGQIEYKLPKIELYFGAEFSNTNFWREGNVKNGLFPEESYGKSETNSYYNIATKLGAQYKISGRHYITANGAFMTRPPKARAAFISPRTRSSTVNGMENELIYTADLSYHVRYSNVKIRLTGYFTEIKNQIWSRSFYHDEYNNFVNYTMTGVDQRHMGLELGADVHIWNGISFVGVAALGDYFYTSRPQATLTVDNSSEVLAEDRTVYLKNYYVGGMPQSAFSAGLKFFKNYWFAGVNFNYFMDIYLDPNPDRRTEEAVTNFVESDPQYAETIEQTKLDNGFTMNAYVGKSFRIANKYYLSINLNATNILNNKDFSTGGYEQLRYDPQNIDKFPPKLAYMYGFNFFAMATFRF